MVITVYRFSDYLALITKKEATRGKQPGPLCVDCPFARNLLFTLSVFDHIL